MLSLILISLKQNTSLLIAAQLKHGRNRKRGGWLPPQRRWRLREGWRARPAPSRLSSHCPVASPGPVSVSRDRGCVEGLCHPCLPPPHCSKNTSGSTNTKREEKVGPFGPTPSHPLSLTAGTKKCSEAQRELLELSTPQTAPRRAPGLSCAQPPNTGVT